MADECRTVDAVSGAGLEGGAVMSKQGKRTLNQIAEDATLFMIRERNMLFLEAAIACIVTTDGPVEASRILSMQARMLKDWE